MTKQYVYRVSADERETSWEIRDPATWHLCAGGVVEGNDDSAFDRAVIAAKAKRRELEAADKAEATELPPVPYEVCQWKEAQEDRKGQRLCWYQQNDQLAWFASYGPGDTDWRPVRISRERVAEMFGLVDPTELELVGWEPGECAWQNPDGGWQSAWLDGPTDIETTSGNYNRAGSIKQAASWGTPVRPVFGKRGGR